jgi:tetratricopeptide (TPR) repeat protein
MTATFLLLLAMALPLSAEPGTLADERSALDAIYILLGERRFSEARDLWNRVGQRIQESVRSASGRTLAPAAERALQRRVAEAWFVQGLLTARFGEREEALRLLRDADGLGFPPLDSPLMVLAADGLHELQEHALAAQAYREVLKRSPGNVPARLRLGVSLYSTGQIAGAEKELGEVLRRAPATPQASFWFGAVRFEQKRYAEAKSLLERELAQDPRCVGCLARLGHVAYLEGDDRLCESWLAKATALDATHVETDLVSGMLAIRSSRYDVAIRHLSRVVERSPGYAQAQYQLALAYRRSGSAEKAREHQEIYARLIQEQKARSIGVRGAEE